MKRVVLESPFADNWFHKFLNIRYARKCIKDSLDRGESPIASHLLYTQSGILDDKKTDDRRLGIDAGHAWLGVCDSLVVYVDRGITSGMVTGIKNAKGHNLRIEYRSLENKLCPHGEFWDDCPVCGH